jgi:hypothetical protein
MVIKFAPKKGKSCKLVSPAPSAEPQSPTPPQDHAKSVDIEKKKPKYDRNAAHKAYMKEYMKGYMREWRKRNPKKKKKDGSPSGTSI